MSLPIYGRISRRGRQDKIAYRFLEAHRLPHLQKPEFRVVSMKRTVEMFGLSPFADTNAVDIELPDDSSVQQLIGALGEAMPSLRGRVIQEGQNKLIENYGLYINGQFVSDDANVRIRHVDRVVLILLATGG